MIGNNAWEDGVYGGNTVLGEYNGCIEDGVDKGVETDGEGCLFWIGNSGCGGGWCGLWTIGVWEDGTTELNEEACMFWIGNRGCGGCGGLIGINGGCPGITGCAEDHGCVEGGGTCHNGWRIGADAWEYLHPTKIRKSLKYALYILQQHGHIINWVTMN